jgi:TonB family protein
MRVSLKLGGMALGLAVAVVIAGCASPPSADIDAAKAAVEKAAAAQGAQYAPESLKAAEAALAALDAELKTQEAKWFPSYEKAASLAADAKAAGEKAAAEAAAAKEKADAAAAAEKAAAEAVEQARKEAVRVGGKIRPPTKTKNVTPVYPAAAKAAGVQGVVIIEAVIGADGKVADAKVLRSVPDLDGAAVAAVKQWEFTPTLLNGKPVPVVMTVTVNFKLK